MLARRTAMLMTRKRKCQPRLFIRLLARLTGPRMMKASCLTFPNSRPAKVLRPSVPPPPLRLPPRPSLDNRMTDSSKLGRAGVDVVVLMDTTMDTEDSTARGVDVDEDEACAVDSVAVSVDLVVSADPVANVANVASVDPVANVDPVASVDLAVNIGKGEVLDLIVHRARGGSGMERAVRGGSGMARGGNTMARGEDAVDADGVDLVDQRVHLQRHQRRWLPLRKPWVDVGVSAG